MSHGVLSTVHDTVQSCLQTTVLAWYTGVAYEVKPVTSGYRLALSYDLIHTPVAPRPSLPNTNSAVHALRHVLLSWKQANSDRVPRKILYLLDGQYPQTGLKGSALEGIDAHKLAILNALANELGFHIGLAILECHLSGTPEGVDSDDEDEMFGRRRGRYCDEYGERRRRGYDCYGDYDSEASESVDPDDLLFKDIDTREASVTGIVKVRTRSASTMTLYDVQYRHSWMVLP